MSERSGICLLTFDLDDTLWELAPVLIRAEATTWAWLVERAPQLLATHDPERLRDERMALAQSRPELAHRVTQLRVLTTAEALRQAGLNPVQAEAMALEALEVFLEARHRITLFDKAEAVLEELASRYRLAAITNGNARLERLGLDRHFAFCVHGEQLPRAKPHPDPFEAALHRAGCRPHQAIHIGDHCDHDVAAAQAVGMHTIWVNRARTAWPGSRLPSAEVASIDALPAVVDQVAATAGSQVELP